MRIETGDITKLEVDAIVNAANETMLSGGGVDHAIHEAAGPELAEACRATPEVSAGVRCPTGEARITPGFRLPAQYVIHTVGPVYEGGFNGEPGLLGDCYKSALKLAVEHDCQSIAFPSISTGAFGYPIREAASVAIATVRQFLQDRGVTMDVIFCCFNKEDAEVYRAVLAITSQASPE